MQEWVAGNNELLTQEEILLEGTAFRNVNLLRLIIHGILIIRSVKSSVFGRSSYLEGRNYEEYKTTNELNLLAEQIQYLTGTEQDVFSVALELEQPGLLKEIVKKRNEILVGYYHYYGITDNIEKLSKFRYRMMKNLFHWLNRRSQMRKSCTFGSVEVRLCNGQKTLLAYEKGMINYLF